MNKIRPRKGGGCVVVDSSPVPLVGIQQAQSYYQTAGMERTASSSDAVVFRPQTIAIAVSVAHCAGQNGYLFNGKTASESGVKSDPYTVPWIQGSLQPKLSIHSDSQSCARSMQKRPNVDQSAVWSEDQGRVNQ